MRYDALRLVCFFDLPMETPKEKRIYRQFRKELISCGFEMLQFSVYYRTCPNRSFANKFSGWECQDFGCYGKTIFRDGISDRWKDETGSTRWR